MSLLRLDCYDDWEHPSVKTHGPKAPLLREVGEEAMTRTGYYADDGKTRVRSPLALLDETRKPYVIPREEHRWAEQVNRLWGECKAIEARREFKAFPGDGTDGQIQVRWFGFEWTLERGLVLTDFEGIPQTLHEIARYLGANAVQVSWHRGNDPRRGIDWHTDWHPDLRALSTGWDSCSLSLGRTRELQVTRIPGDVETGQVMRPSPYADLEMLVPMHHGDLTVYPADAHRAFLHRVLPGQGERFSVQFRRYADG